MDAANSGSGIDRELEEVIKGGVASGRFSSTSRVALLEGTADRISMYQLPILQFIPLT